MSKLKVKYRWIEVFLEDGEIPQLEGCNVISVIPGRKEYTPDELVGVVDRGPPVNSLYAWVLVKETSWE